jgi:hypothetical protein
MRSLLLAAYPARLRRRYGAEILATMAEAAGPAGPTRADRARLVQDGLRERLRLPPGRPLAVVAAVLAMLAGGALGAAIGSWAGMWTYPAVPDLGPVASQAVGADATLPADPTRQRLWSYTVGALTPGVDAVEAAGRARDRLTAAGWRPEPVAVSGGDGVQFRRAAFDAEKSGVHLQVTAYYSDDRQVLVGSWSMRPPTYVPLVLGGLVLGLLAGWPVAAALSYRIAGAGRRRTGAVVAGVGLALLLVPAESIYRYLADYLPSRPGFTMDQFVYRALTSDNPVGAVADRLNLGLGWTDDPGLNRTLAMAGLTALLAAVVIARPARSDQDPAGPQVA